MNSLPLKREKPDKMPRPLKAIPLNLSVTSPKRAFKINSTRNSNLLKRTTLLTTLKLLKTLGNFGPKSSKRPQKKPTILNNNLIFSEARLLNQKAWLKRRMKLTLRLKITIKIRRPNLSVSKTPLMSNNRTKTVKRDPKKLTFLKWLIECKKSTRVNMMNAVQL